MYVLVLGRNERFEPKFAALSCYSNCLKNIKKTVTFELSLEPNFLYLSAELVNNVVNF